MSTTIDQKAYLQKYLSGPSGDKKKKKKKAMKGKGFKIIDDDIDLSKLRPLDGDELDVLDQGEDAPQIAGIIDERPEEIKKLEQFKTTSKWRVINQDDGFSSKLQIEEIRKDIKELEKENELIFGKMYSDSEDEKQNDSDLSASKKENDSDLSPPRKQNVKDKIKNAHTSSKTHQNHSDSDFSPPRRNNAKESLLDKSKNKIYDSVPSPPRRHDSQKPKEKVRKPSRWADTDKTESRQRSPDSDATPPRRSKTKRNSQSPPLKSKRDIEKRRKSPSSDMSPPRRSQKVDRGRRHKSKSPMRKSRKDSPKKRNRSDSDASPPRKRKHSPDNQNKNYSNKYKSDERHYRGNNKNTEQSQKRHSSDSDMSPQRKNKPSLRYESPLPKRSRGSPPKRNYNRKHHNSDSDLSPPRKERDKKTRKRSNDSPPPSNKKMARTLEGKKAGLQDAVQLRQENEAIRKKEDEVFNKMTDEVSGRNAQVVSRKSKRETSEERQKQKEKADRQKELDEKYKKWGRGLKQMEAQEARVQEFMHEASKPLARHKGDRDLEANLKQIEREGDPMLQYIREKKRERGKLGPEKPSYKGSFPPNRFNIRPGYRWDGVDRSNGYEKKYFEQQSKKKAQEEEAYKWSTEDL